MDISWMELANAIPLLAFCLTLIWAVVKLAPTYKEIRANDNAAKTQLASAMALVASAVSDGNKLRAQESKAITHLADVVQSIAQEQRKAIEAVRIMQRVQADGSDRLNDSVQELSERVAALERVRLESNARHKTIRTP